MIATDQRPGRFSLERLKALTDGVVAIVLTILVLELDVPPAYDFSKGGLGPFIGQMEHQLLPYIASFALVGGYWLIHNFILNRIGTTDRTFLLINLVFMLPLTLIPFVTEMRADYRGQVSIAAIYGSIQVVISLLLLVIWHYARTQLAESPVAQQVVRSLNNRIIAIIAMNIVGVVLVPINEYLATIAFVCVPLLLIRHRTIDKP